ncbi:MAG TPA: hypothetical protein VEB64_08350 [Azospirillaceae bacterium]|nr:hypothetical protein [Azospirillaceae bacterium]
MVDIGTLGLSTTVWAASVYLQRLIMPDGTVSWTAYDDAGIVPEVREFVLYLEARHYAPSTVHHYARHVVRLGNYLNGFGKNFAHLTPLDLDRFIPLVVKYGKKFDATSAANIIPIRIEHIEVSNSLYNQILFTIKVFYEFLNMRHATAVFDQEIPANYSPDTYKPFL